MTIDKPLIMTGEQLAAGRARASRRSCSRSTSRWIRPRRGTWRTSAIFVYWANAERPIFIGGGTTTPLSAAAYNPANQSLTLVPSARCCRWIVSIGITVNGSASPVLGNGLADTYGGLLEGSSGVPGTPVCA